VPGSTKPTERDRSAEATGELLAVSDLHVGHPDNRAVLDGLQPAHDADWLLVAGDVGERMGDIEWALRTLAGRFSQVIWVPGNHELWSSPSEPSGPRGVARYESLVEICRDHGVLTPEDPYPVWRGDGGPVRIAPLFLLYDYTFLAPGTADKAESLTRAHETGVVCNDEFLLAPDPYPSREAWCRERVAWTQRRLADNTDDLPLVLVSHWPLTREPTRVLWYPEFAQWCGTELTADWHTRFPVTVSVYGHLHIPRTTWQDSVRFEEVSLGYPREWRSRPYPPIVPRRILPHRQP
jgi:3',5'-cyclic AMP phosphodiesterase CpdA